MMRNLELDIGSRTRNGEHETLLTLEAHRFSLLVSQPRAKSHDS
jgi:hypothetical protein